ncbi:MAG: hypothetical protein ACYDCP_04900 [Thermoplasmataceae archaeon]
MLKTVVRETVFGSKKERSVYYKLLKRWGKTYNIYLSLPVANVFQVDSKELKSGEKVTYFQSSIDYTFSSKEDKPLFSVEFDGIGKGYSRGNKYIQTETSNLDPYRKLKLEFKLKLAENAGYPFVVVSYEEVSELDEEETLTILDGIVGQLTSKRKFDELLSKFLEDEREILDSMTQSESEEYLQNMVTSVEVEAELESDPIALKAAEYQQEISKFGINGHKMEPLYDPELPEAIFPPRSLEDLESLEKRINAFKNIRKHGYKISVETSEGIISRSAWVREYKAYGVSSISLALNIAEFLAYKSALKILSKKFTPSSK